MDYNNALTQIVAGITQLIQPHINSAVASANAGVRTFAIPQAPMDPSKHYFMVGRDTIHDTDSWNLG